MNTGYTIKQTAEGFKVEYFRMNSCTLEVIVMDTKGPFQTKDEAEVAESNMRKGREHAE